MTDPTKPWDEKKPLMRINSPSMNGTQLTGNGHRHGTRRANLGPSSLGGLIFAPSGFGPEDDFLCRGWMDRNVTRQILRAVPSWVQTEGAAPEDPASETLANVELEVAGKLARSFQTWTDAPMMQYHKWYDWNFHVQPDPEYDWVRSVANHPPNITEANATAVIPEMVMECEWDAGAIGNYSFPTDPNPIYSAGRPPDQPGTDVKWMGGPMFERDWAWPMADDYVWLCGRSIYDGGHEEHNLCRSELHPVKAIACVRKEGVIFYKDKGKQTPYHKGKIPDGSGSVPPGLAVPAYQFLFYANIHGGYFDWPSLAPKNGQPYEFIVDLPEAPWEKGPQEVAIASSENVKYNTIVLRDQELLTDCDHDRFDISRTVSSGGSTVDPAWTLVDLPQGATNPYRRQVKVTIPLSALQNEFYGALLSLGWRDHSGMTIARTRKCEVRFTHLKTGHQNHDRFAEEWRLKGGVQGRWRQFNFDPDHSEPGRGKGPKIHWMSDHDLQAPPGHESELSYTFYLDENVPLRFTTHGAELNMVDDKFFEATRTLMIDAGELAVERRAPTNQNDRTAVVNAFTGRGLTPPTWQPTAAQPPGFNGGAAVWGDQIDRRPFCILPTSFDRPQNGGATDAWRWLITYPEQRATVRGVRTVMSNTWGDGNSPLGIIDAGKGTPSEADKNPLIIKGRPVQVTVTNRLTAFFTLEIEPLAELAERPHSAPGSENNLDIVDYWVDYEVKLTSQYK